VIYSLLLKFRSLLTKKNLKITLSVTTFLLTLFIAIQANKIALLNSPLDYELTLIKDKSKKSDKQKNTGLIKFRIKVSSNSIRSIYTISNPEINMENASIVKINNHPVTPLYFYKKKDIPVDLSTNGLAPRIEESFHTQNEYIVIIDNQNKLHIQFLQIVYSTDYMSVSKDENGDSGLFVYLESPEHPLTNYRTLDIDYMVTKINSSAVPWKMKLSNDNEKVTNIEKAYLDKQTIDTNKILKDIKIIGDYFDNTYSFRK
ncbi:hypothetical protein HB847_15800, partial [Listeria booriae]